MTEAEKKKRIERLEKVEAEMKRKAQRLKKKEAELKNEEIKEKRRARRHARTLAAEEIEREKKVEVEEKRKKEKERLIDAKKKESQQRLKYEMTEKREVLATTSLKNIEKKRIDNERNQKPSSSNLVKAKKSISNHKQEKISKPLEDDYSFNDINTLKENTIHKKKDNENNDRSKYSFKGYQNRKKISFVNEVRVSSENKTNAQLIGMEIEHPEIQEGFIEQTQKRTRKCARQLAKRNVKEKRNGSLYEEECQEIKKERMQDLQKKKLERKMKEHKHYVPVEMSINESKNNIGKKKMIKYGKSHKEEITKIKHDAHKIVNKSSERKYNTEKRKKDLNLVLKKTSNQIISKGIACSMLDPSLDEENYQIKHKHVARGRLVKSKSKFLNLAVKEQDNHNVEKVVSNKIKSSDHHNHHVSSQKSKKRPRLLENYANKVVTKKQGKKSKFLFTHSPINVIC